MLNPKSLLATLFSAPMQFGKVIWIGLRPARRQEVEVVEAALAEAGQGLVGDRYKTRTNGARQVTLIQAEHLAAVASYLRLNAIDPRLTRRNIVVQGINLLALKDKNFTIGEVLFEYTGECHPCSRMEETLGIGAYNAMRGHGGITARVLGSGKIALGDTVQVATLDTRRDNPLS